MPQVEIKIGQVLKRLLREKRKNLKEVARDTGISYSTLYTWQENRSPKDIVKAHRLAAYLGISFHELLFDSKDFQADPVVEPTLEAADEFFKGKFEIVVRRID